MGANNALPKCLWSLYFIEGQGHTVEELNFHQDNMGATLMENNGKESSTNCTKHIIVRYFFIKGSIKNMKLYSKYFLTG